MGRRWYGALFGVDSCCLMLSSAARAQQLHLNIPQEVRDAHFRVRGMQAGVVNIYVCRSEG